MNTRTPIGFCSGLAVLSAVVACHAGPLGNSNVGGEYMVGTQNLWPWSFSVLYESQKRDVTPLGRLQSQQYIGCVGFDPLRWLTVYAGAGSGTTKFSGLSNPEDNPTYLLGAHFNLLDHQVASPTMFEERIRINADLQYSVTRADSGIDWSEFYGSLTVSIVNDVEGNKIFLPNSIALFVGPVFSDLESDVFDEESTTGYTLGIEVFLSEKVSLGYALEELDGSSYTVGLNVRF